MREFTDATGNVWPLAITAGTVKRVQDLLAVDIGQPLAGPTPWITRFDSDIVFKVDVICAVCRPVMAERGVSDEDFAAGLGGEALYAASMAFWEELTDFFRSLRRSEIVAAMSRQREIIERAMELTTAKISGTEMTELIAQEMAKTEREIDDDLAARGEPAANSPPSPAAPPSPAPSES